MASPFDFIKSVAANKEYMFTGNSSEDAIITKDYVPYLINKSLSFNQDTILFALEMSRYMGELSNKAQYDFYYYGIPKKFRKIPWYKKDKQLDEIKAIQQYYQVNTRRAEEIAKTLSPEQLDSILEIIEKGGRTK